MDRLLVGNMDEEIRRAYLDIETSRKGTITILGVYRPLIGTKQLVAPHITAKGMDDMLGDTDIIFTYNGSRFDLPVIERYMGVDLESRFEHRDLMFDCWSHNLYGGLKKVEEVLGIHRDTEGIDGMAAMRMWEKYMNEKDGDVLEMLLRYNREDVENLEQLAYKLKVVQ